MKPTQPLALAAMLLALTMGMASCSASEPAKPGPSLSEDISTPVPSASVEPAVAFADVTL